MSKKIYAGWDRDFNDKGKMFVGMYIRAENMMDAAIYLLKHMVPTKERGGNQKYFDMVKAGGNLPWYYNIKFNTKSRWAYISYYKPDVSSNYVGEAKIHNAPHISATEAKRYQGYQ